MRIDRFLVCLAIWSCVMVGAWALPVPVPTKQTTRSALDVTVYFESVAVTQGSLKESGSRHVEVHLPASYAYQPTRRFPVVYAFHGFGGSPSELIQALGTLPPGAADSGTTPEFIVVGIDGSNRRLGSFYVNSPVTGNFESLVIDEVIPMIDANFRTLPARGSRLAAGFSMGGFAAWNLALAHPDVFAAAWACCPGVFDTTGLKDALANWNGVVRSAYGSAFAPRQANPAKAPVFDGSPADSALVTAWESGYGDFAGKLQRYLRLGVPLQEIRFDYGSNDSYQWIPRGTLALNAFLNKAGVTSSAVAHPSDHIIAPSMLTQGLIPLIQRVFSVGPLKS